MRVAGGSSRGVRLRSPHSSAVRPTTSQVRSAIFNILGPRMIEGAVAADFYAGIGTLGVEGLSRGASYVNFVEVGHQQCAIIAANLHATGFTHQATVIHKRVESVLLTLEMRHDIVLMDPPYTQPFPTQVLQHLGTNDRLLHSDSVVVVVHSSRVVPGSGYGRLALRQDRRYGDVSVAFYEVK